MQFYPAALLKLIPPAVVICVTLVGRNYVDALDKDLRLILDYLPYLVCVVVVFMANLFSRSRLMLAALAIAACYWTVQTYLQVSLDEPEALAVYQALSLAAPLLGLYLLLLPERGTWTRYGMASSAAFVVLGAISLQLGPWLPGVNETTADYYATRPFEGYVLSLGASLLMGVVALAGLLLLLLRNDEVDAALLAALACIYLSLALLHEAYISVTMSTAAALCLVWGLLRSYHTMAYRDELTGLPGRRALNERIKMLGSRYSIAMLDVDHFKRFNDTYGHDVGDQVLKLVASRIRRVGGGGTAYRYGGEEFCVVFPRRSVADAAASMESVREEIANYTMSLRDQDLRPARKREGSKRRGATRIGSNQVSVTVSAGVAARDEDKRDGQSVITAADKMLYKAKKAGRNRVVYK